MTRDQAFEKILQAAENPKNIGQGFWELPENPTPSQLVKYELCEKILGYQEDNNLTDKEIARKINLTLPETEDILFCRIEKVNSDELINAAGKLFSPAQVKISLESKKTRKTPHAPMV